MDRNWGAAPPAPSLGWSLSARRAWIEMPSCPWTTPRPAVALRKESVDRNRCGAGNRGQPPGRSPQGERG